MGTHERDGISAMVGLIALAVGATALYIFGNRRKLKTGEVRGSDAHRIYHRQGCEYGDKIRRRVRIFPSCSRAESDGYRACHICQPDRFGITVLD